MDATLTRLRELDPRIRIGAGAVALLLVLGGVLAVANASSSSGSRTTPVESPTTQPSATRPRARATPFGTPAPHPQTARETSASVEVNVPPLTEPTPMPEPGLWRLEGYVVDESGQPIENVCVVIGPLGCQSFSPHTDERGHYFVDVAAAQVTFDFYFEMPGHETVWWRTSPSGSTAFNLVLHRG
jgi:hypothetical protein